jgi:hypothetical protein
MPGELLTLPSHLNALVYTEENFDAAFEAGEFPAVDARACSTIGISRFLRDAHGLDMDQGQFFEEIPAQQVKVGRWPIRKTELVHAPEAAVLIGENRGFGGVDIAEKDLLHAEYPELLAFLKRYNRRLPYFYQMEYSPRNSNQEVAIKWLGESVVDDVNERVSHRAGVQVIYGGEDFDEQIYNQSISDDNHQMARQLEGQRIPSQFFRAIVPLGEYERSLLL